MSYIQLVPIRMYKVDLNIHMLENYGKVLIQEKNSLKVDVRNSVEDHVNFDWKLHLPPILSILLFLLFNSEGRTRILNVRAKSFLLSVCMILCLVP